MSRNSLTQIEELFLEALQQPLASRDSWVVRQCAGDETLQRTIESLLDVHDSDSASILDQASSLPLADCEWQKEADCRDDSYPFGKTLGQYVLLRQLGQGGMGTVFLAFEREPIQRVVALKLLKQGLNTSAMLHHFAVERQSLAQLKHASIPRIFNAGTAPDGRAFLVMEYIDGRDIRSFCNEERLSVSDRIRLFVKVCEAVSSIHQQHIVHCDIKPSNVLVSVEEGIATPRLIDFGIATAVQNQSHGASVSHPQPFAGTVDYMSPEQSFVENSTTDVRSDIYSLGALLYELLTQQTPFAEWCQHRLSERLDALRHRTPTRTIDRLDAVKQADIDRFGKIDRVTMKCLSRLPEDRYQTATDLLTDLQHCLGEHQRVDLRIRTPERANVGGRQTRRLLAAGLSAVLLMLILVSTMTDDRHSIEQVTATKGFRKALADDSIVKIDNEAYQQIATILRENGVAAADKTFRLSIPSTNTNSADTRVVTVIPSSAASPSATQALVARPLGGDEHSG